MLKLFFRCSSILFVVCIFLFPLSNNISAQSFTISGVSGISFDTTGGDFTVDFTDDFTVFGITVSPQSLSFSYTESENLFELDGTVGTSFDGETVDATLDLDISDEALESVVFSVSADFDLKSLTISPTDLGFEWTGGTNFGIFGDIDVSFDDETLTASLGDSDDPGVVIEDGTITSFSISVSADFEIKSLTVAPTDLTFEYDTGEEYFEMYGDIEFDIGDDAVVANLGDSDDPGLIVDDGSITEINIGITEDFTFSGLSVKTEDLGVEWKSGSEFYLYGDANLSVDSETIDTDFGTSSDPGLVIEDGSLKSFEVDVNSDLTLGNLEVEAKDLDIAYSSGVFEVTGELEITEVFSLSVTLGSDDAPGLEIDVSGSEPSFKVEDLTIEIDNADLGTVDLKSFVLSFDENGITDSEVDVVFASGTEIDAEIKFAGDPASIDEISITYTADNLEEALELFEGIQIAEMSGTVGNLTNTSNLYVDADLTAIFGGGFTISDESATLLEMYDAVSIDASSFSMSGDVNVGAYENSSGDWKSLLGDGSFSFDVNFDESDVLIDVDVNIPSDPMVEVDASVYIDTDKDFDALIDVTFYVPSSIPFIGGDKLGSVDGAVRYKHDDISDSYAAAWDKIKVLFVKYYLGAKYKFESQSISTFDSKSKISDIKDDIEDDESEKTLTNHSSYIVSSHTFELSDDPIAPNYLQFIADWGSEIDSVLITVVGPTGIHELTRATLISKDDSTGLPTFGYEENMTWVTNDTGAVFIIHSPTAMSEEEIGHSRLLDGRYQVLISLPRGQAPDSVALDVSEIYQYPIIDLEVNGSTNTYELDASYWSVLPDSTHLTFYVNNTPSHDLARMITHVEAENFDEDGYGSESIIISPNFNLINDSLYFFAVIDDGINPPEKTDISNPVIYSPDVYGTVTFPDDADSLKAYLRVFLDEDKDGSFDTESTGGLEYFAITNANGMFSLHDIEEGDYELRIVLPPGYRFVGGVDRKTHTPITFDGTPIELDLEIEAYTEAE